MRKMSVFIIGICLLACRVGFAEGQSCGPNDPCPRGELCDPFDNKCRIGPKIVQSEADPEMVLNRFNAVCASPENFESNNDYLRVCLINQTGFSPSTPNVRGTCTPRGSQYQCNFTGALYSTEAACIASCK